MSLTELLLALSISALLALIAAPSLRHARDVVNVRAARETTFALAARTRSVALERSGAALIIETDPPVVSIVDSDGRPVDTESLAPFDVRLEVDGTAGRVGVVYDSRGIGRMASSTLRIARGDARAGLTISSYGRIRRW